MAKSNTVTCDSPNCSKRTKTAKEDWLTVGTMHGGKEPLFFSSLDCLMESHDRIEDELLPKAPEEELEVPADEPLHYQEDEE